MTSDRRLARCERPEREAREARRERQRSGRGPGHHEMDRRGLELTRITVARIDENPALVQTGLDNIDRWLRQNGGTLPRAHAEWQTLIRRHPWPALRRMLLEESDEGQRLRSSHPLDNGRDTTKVSPERATGYRFGLQRNGSGKAGKSSKLQMK